MSISSVGTPEIPELITVSLIALDRLPDKPFVTLSYTETVRVWEKVVTVTACSDEDTDLLYETLTVPEWQTAEFDPTGYVLYLEDGDTVVGTVLSWDTITGIATIDPEAGTDLTNETIKPLGKNSLGMPQHRAAQNGNYWHIQLKTDTVDQQNYLASKMIGCHVEAAIAVLDRLGISYDPLQVASAAQQALLEGDSIDTMLSRTAESIELDRQAGTLPTGTLIHGNVPS